MSNQTIHLNVKVEKNEKKKKQAQKCISGLKDREMLDISGNVIIQLLEDSSSNCMWIIYLISRDVVTELKKKKQKRSLSCLFPRDLTIIHTMDLLTLRTLLFRRCEDVVFLLAVFLKCFDCCKQPVQRMSLASLTEASRQLNSGIPLTSQEMQLE